MLHALNAVAPGGGAATIVPGSHHQTYAAAERLGSTAALETLKRDPIGVADIDVKDAIKGLPNEGDLLISNPICLHSASANVSTSPRYD